MHAELCRNDKSLVITLSKFFSIPPLLLPGKIDIFAWIRINLLPALFTYNFSQNPSYLSIQQLMHQSNNHNNVTMKKESPSVSLFELANGKGHTPKSVFFFFLM